MGWRPVTAGPRADATEAANAERVRREFDSLSKHLTNLHPLATSQLLHVRDEKASGTNGGTFTSGAWQTRTLNTEKANTITGASLAANNFTLPAGAYLMEARAPAFAVNAHKARITNETDSTVELVGSSAVSGVNASGPGDSIVKGLVTIAATKAFELQHFCELTKANNGFGAKVTSGEDEVYAEVMIWKVA